MTASIAVIFDLDGTLVDSFKQILKCCMKIREQLNLKPLSEMELQKLIGLPAEELFSDGSFELREEAVSRFRAELLVEINKSNDLFHGAETLLRELKCRNILIGVATSKPHEMALKVVKNSTLYGYVDFVQGLDGFDAKPNPEVILRCKSKLLAREYVMVGDRPEDVHAAIQANCYSVGVAQGCFTEEQLAECGAHEVFSSLYDMVNQIDDFLIRVDSRND